MSVIYMIRHAQASFGKDDYDMLSDLGRQQAQILAGHLHQSGFMFDRIYSGLQLRHEQTLALYLDGCAASGKPLPDIEKTGAFNEYDSKEILTVIIPILIRENSAFESEVSQIFKDNRSFQKVLEKVMSRWTESNDPIDNLETWKTYCSRVWAAIDDLMTMAGAGKNVAVFTSGGPIAVTVQKALNLPVKETLNLMWQIVNTSITRFKFSGRRLALFGFNDFSHLESAQDSRLITYR